MISIVRASGDTRRVASKRAQRSFAEELPDLLHERGLSIRAVAREAQVNDAHLSRLLRGVGYRTKPSADLASRVAVALGLPFDYFVEFRESTVVDEVRRNAELRERLYDRMKKGR
jgi:transcriptional regulator with XRE-family HTH domain